MDTTLHQSHLYIARPQKQYTKRTSERAQNQQQHLKYQHIWFSSSFFLFLLRQPIILDDIPEKVSVKRRPSFFGCTTQ